MTKINDDFVHYILELLHPLGSVHAKRMFGGYGIFKDGLMFGLISQQMLYLKADSVNSGTFVQAGLERFCYRRLGKPTYLSYYQAPIDALENGELLIEWAKRSIDVALRHAGNTNRAM